MKKVFTAMVVVGAAVTFLTGSLSWAADQTRTRQRLRDGSCLTTQNPGTQTRQTLQQRGNPGSGSQTRSQEQFRGGR